MNRFWKNLILPLFNEFKPKCIVEIGCFKGENTKNILDYCLINDSKLICIDPNPDPIFNPGGFKEKFGDKFEFYKELSLERISLLDNYDAVLIDGDHNWYTVYNELKLIEKKFNNKNFPLIILHDVSWPYARRDLYYNPQNIPLEYRHPYKKAAIFPGIEELVEIGLNPTLNNAIYENNPKNGVLTAIEDFLKETSLDLSFYSFNVFYGLGIICSDYLIDEETILKIFYESNIIGLLEETYLKIRFSNERIIHEKNKMIADLNGNVSSLNLKVNELDNINSSLDEKVSKLENSNVLLEDRVSVLDGVISSKDKVIADRDGEISKLEGYVSSFKTKIKEFDKDVSSLNLKIDELGKINSSLDKKVFELEKIKNNQENVIENLEKENYSLSYQNDSLKEDNLILVKTNKMFLEDLRDLNVKNQDLEEAIVELKKDYSLLEKEKDSLLISRSWRITSPLRKIFRFFK